MGLGGRRWARGFTIEVDGKRSSQHARDAGDDQVGTLDLCVAVCANRCCAGGEWMAFAAGTVVDRGVHGFGAERGDGVQPAR